MSYYKFFDCYAIEQSFIDTDLIDGAGDTAYLLGAISRESEMPSPTYTDMFPAVGVNAYEVTAGTSWVKQEELRGMINLTMQHGVPIWLAMGASSTAGADPYTHTITPTTDGSSLPSIVWQHEEKGGATDEEYQFQGVKCDTLTLEHDMQQGAPNCLLASLDVLAAKALDPGFAMTSSPALPSDATATPYVALTRTYDYGSGNIALNGLQKLDIIIANGLQPEKAHSYDSVTHAYTGDTPFMFSEAKRKEYRILMLIDKQTIERTIWDDMIAQTNTKEVYFKWTKSTNDYIECTATNCNIVGHPLKTPKVKQPYLVTVILKPEALSFTVKDSIAGGAYGE